MQRMKPQQAIEKQCSSEFNLKFDPAKSIVS